jgi:hypothetical protein
MNRKQVWIVFWMAVIGAAFLEKINGQTVLFTDPDPFGTFETPLDGQTVSGDILLSGWVMDDNAGVQVKIYRLQGAALVYIGDAYILKSLRPDITAAYTEPDYYGGGWQFHLITHFLPGGGNGTYTLEVRTSDGAGNIVSLGQKTILCDNEGDPKPFGAIDTPVQGGIAMGNSYFNWGWALTPIPSKIPTDGSSIDVFVDGVNMGHPEYGLYRSDIAAFFPGYANSDSAVGYFKINTTLWTDGLHIIWWSVTDDMANNSIMGSRYFYIQNGPEIEIRGTGHLIAHGDTKPSVTDWTDYREVVANMNTVGHTFTIHNTGGDTLHLTGLTGRVTVVGEGFSVTNQPGEYVLPGDTAYFAIRFAPASLGLKIATVTIPSSDADENPYTFGIQGTGITATDAGDPETGSRPYGFSLEQNYPNPFNPNTEILYFLPAPAHVSMTIYNICGKKVLTLKQEHEDAGEHRAVWNGMNQYREQVPSGIYICRMKADGAEKAIRMLLMK